MAVDVLTQILVHAPVSDVSAYAADPANAPEWYVNIQSAEWRTDAPLRVGSRVAFVAHFLGRRLEYVYEVLEWEAGHRLVMATIDSGPFPMETTYTWSAESPGTTRMTLRNRGTPTGFFRLLAPLMSRAMRSANERDLAELKTLVESRCRSTTTPGAE